MIGILSLQGCIGPHERLLAKLGASSMRVRSKDDLSKVERIILPGGESTTMLKLLNKNDLFEPLKNFCTTNPVWGICAGAILLAREVTNPNQQSLGVMDISAHRNYYGCQLDSFSVEISSNVFSQVQKVDFIRAPLLSPLIPDVEVLSSLEDQPVLLRQDNMLASSFHVELRENLQLYKYFLDF